MTDGTGGRGLTGVETRLRQALEGHAGRVGPVDEGASLARIEARLRAPSRSRRRRTAALASLAVAAGVVVVVGMAALVGDGDGQRLRTTAPAGTTTTSAPAGTTTVATVVAPAVVADAVWPPEGHAPFADPVDAARSLAEDFVGIEDPRLSAFRALDATSGEVDVSVRRENGTFAVSGTVSLAAAAGSWWVTSARATDIVVDNPKPLDSVGSTVVVDGRGRGFEGNVVIEVREAGMGAGSSLAQVPVIAGCCERLEPFHAELVLAPRSKPTGSLLLGTEGQFMIVPVRFGSTPTSGPQAGDETTVEVFWVDAGGRVVAAPRTVRRSQGVLRQAVGQLLLGPRNAEREAGLGSALAPEAAGVTFSVTLRDGTAVVDFGAGLPAASPATSAAAASERFLRQLHATVFQFPTVTRAEYRAGGDCAAFWAWLQRGCTTVDRRRVGF